jgi:hypothetical protein
MTSAAVSKDEGLTRVTRADIVPSAWVMLQFYNLEWGTLTVPARVKVVLDGKAKFDLAGATFFGGRGRTTDFISLDEIEKGEIPVYKPSADLEARLSGELSWIQGQREFLRGYEELVRSGLPQE